MSTQRFLICAFAVSVWCAAPAAATVLNYSTPTAFATATGSDTFSNLTFVQGNLMSTMDTVGDVVFSTNATTLTGIDGSTFSGWPTQQGIQASSGKPNTSITLSIPATANAISFYFGSPVTIDQYIFNVTDAAGGIYHVEPNVNANAPYFIGLTTDSTFTSLSIMGYNSNDALTIADVNLGDGDMAPTPEVGTFLMVGGGLFGLRFVRRRRRSAKPAQEAFQAASSTYQSATSVREAI